MTTNGVLLEKYAVKLKKAGLNRVNVSLDSLRHDRFRKITRMGKLDDVLRGIEAAKQAGLNPVKINMVVMRGTNDDEILHFTLLTISDGWHVRFIEFMPFMEKGKDNRLLVPVSEMMKRIEALHRAHVRHVVVTRMREGKQLVLQMIQPSPVRYVKYGTGSISW